MRAAASSREEKLTIQRRALARGGTIAPQEIIFDHAAQDMTITLTVDDPTAVPPTDAKVMLTVEAHDGERWVPVSHSWGGTSGVMTMTVPVRGRRVRVRVRADEATTIDIAAAV